MSPRAQVILNFWFIETPSEKRFKNVLERPYKSNQKI